MSTNNCKRGKAIFISSAVLALVTVVAVSCSQQTKNNGILSDTTTPATSQTTEKAEDKVSYDITYNKCYTFPSMISSAYTLGITEITNTGDSDLYLSSGKFDIEKSDGSIAASKDYVSVYPQVISPGEKAYYFDVGSVDNISVEDSLKIDPHLNVEKASVEKIRLEITESSLNEDMFSGIKVIGRVHNNTGEEQSMIYVSVILFDSKDEPLAVLFTILSDKLGADGVTGFEASALILPDVITSDSVARYEVYAYPFQYQF